MLEPQRRLVQTKLYYKIFYSLQKEMPERPLEIAVVCISLIQLASVNDFIPCDNWKISFFIQNLSLPRGLVQLPCCCVLTDSADIQFH